MSRMINKGLVLAVVLGALAADTFAQPPAAAPRSVPELRQDANRAYSAEDFRAFRDAVQALHKLRPNNSEYMYRLALAHALLDEKTAAYNMMLKMQRQGLSYDFDASEDSANIRGTEVYEYLNDLMKRAGSPFGEALTVTTLAEDVVRPEAIAWDAGRAAFLVGTVSQGEVLAVRRDGTTEVLLRADDVNGLWGVHDLLVDAGRNRLWLSSAASPEFNGFSPADKGRSALFEFQLDTMELIEQYPVPVDGRAHRLGNMVLAPNGDIYLADRLLPIIYVKRADEQKLQPFFGTSLLVSLRGITISDDGRILYAADFEMGILCIDLEAKKPQMLKFPETLNLGGIEGLDYWDGNLVVIQNGIRPQRLMRLKLDEEGLGVADVAPLAVALEAFDYPNDGTIVDELYYYFANSHRGRDPGSRRPVTILSSDLQGAQNLVPPDMQKFLEEQAGKTQQAADEAEPDAAAREPSTESATDSGG